MNTVVAFLVSFSVVAVSVTTDPCAQMCHDLGDSTACASSGKGSYCKFWQRPAVCYGFKRRKDNTLCYVTGVSDDANCSGAPVACPSGPPFTTAVPSTPRPTHVPTTEPPCSPTTTRTSTTVNPCDITTTKAAPRTSTTVNPCDITTTKAAPRTSTTVNPCDITTTKAAPRTSTTVNPCDITTTKAAPRT
ncbi:conserved hypothetical protein, partial [Perkinsus marinus ATCC 50983]